MLIVSLVMSDSRLTGFLFPQNKVFKIRVQSAVTHLLYGKPKLMAADVEDSLISAIKKHIEKHRLKQFSIVFHGGEPLLFPKKRFRILCDRLARVASETGCAIKKSLTTNGTLIDAAWCEIFLAYGISCAISVDLSAAAHNKHRIDFKGQGSYERTIAGLNTLRLYPAIKYSLLAVADPSVSPRTIFDHFVGTLKVHSFDVLIPDHTWDEEKPVSIAVFYKELFTLWYSEYPSVNVRILESIARLVLGYKSRTMALGAGQLHTPTINSDGSIEALDTLRIAGTRHLDSEINVKSHELDDVALNPIFGEVLRSTQQLPDACRACEYRRECGGGFVGNRWSRERRYDNVSVYCEDFKEIFHHARSVVLQDAYVLS